MLHCIQGEGRNGLPSLTEDAMNEQLYPPAYGVESYAVQRLQSEVFTASRIPLSSIRPSLALTSLM